VITSTLLTTAISARLPLFDAEHEGAFRIFNGFTEGAPELVLEVYGRCLLIHDFTSSGDKTLQTLALDAAREVLPWLTSAVVKPRGQYAGAREGRIVFGDAVSLPQQVAENGVRYALDVLLNRDASFYIDTRGLRAWAKATLAGKRVLNTFAYTGTLGVAAAMAPASRVINSDANAQFLSIAKRSMSLNHRDLPARDYRADDFFDLVSRLKKENALFDCIFLDPPLFAHSKKGDDKGKVDVQTGMSSLINKVRPLLGHEGFLVAVNNAAFVSGATYQAALDALCSDYLKMDTRIEVPEDCLGMVRQTPLLTDPTPFNHSTKIAVMRTFRKDGRRA
jgi:23S rRNA (cytosine1962-C5)-methyltransferase